MIPCTSTDCPGPPSPATAYRGSPRSGCRRTAGDRFSSGSVPTRSLHHDVWGYTMTEIALFGRGERSALIVPIVANNPIGVQVLGICSALAVTTRLDKALVMGIGVTIVTACANVAVST